MGSEPAELVWEADIRTGFLRERRDCFGNAGTAVRNSWIPLKNSGDGAGRATLGKRRRTRGDGLNARPYFSPGSAFPVTGVSIAAVSWVFSTVSWVFSNRTGRVGY